MATIAVAMETMGNDFQGNQMPKTNLTYDLGSSSLKWRTLYTDKIYINGSEVSVDNIAYIGSPHGDPLMKSGGAMSGNINWEKTNQGLAWRMNTDGAGIRFMNEGDADTNSFLEFYTLDNLNEGFKWISYNDSTHVWMELNQGILKVNGSRVFTESHPPSSSNVDAIGPKGNWTTNGGQDLLVHGKRALVGFSSGELHLGYGGDFSTIKCGNNHTIYHTGNLNSSTDLNLRSLSLGHAFIKMGGRTLSIQYSDPGGPDGTIWIK